MAARSGALSYPGSPSRQALVQGVIYVVLALWAALSLFPLYWLFTTSFQSFGLTIQFPLKLFPQPFTLTNFHDVLALSLIHI